MATEEAMNEYEALRLAKIARNEARLRELGLIKTRPRKTEPRRRKAKDPPRKNDSSSLLPAVSRRTKPVAPLRRSKRLRHSPESMPERQLPRVIQEEEEVQTQGKDNLDVAFHPGNDEKVDKKRLIIRTKQNAPAPSNLSARKAPISPNSARAMTLDLDKLVTDSLLAMTLTKTGKAHVMEESAKLGVQQGYEEGDPISFNKYSGVQEWENAAFLWINLDAPNSDVFNDFFDGGRQVTWFGGSRMHEGSPAIQRLLSIGKKQQPPSDNGGEGGVVLWCRRYIREHKTFEPYTCLGRLSYISHESGSHPLPFVWKLDDFDRMANHPDKARRETFRSFVERH